MRFESLPEDTRRKAIEVLEANRAADETIVAVYSVDGAADEHA